MSRRIERVSIRSARGSSSDRAPRGSGLGAEIVAIAALGCGLVGIAVYLLAGSGGVPNLLNGFAGAAIGGVAAVVAVVASLRSLQRQLLHQEVENAKAREYDSLARLMAALGAVEAAIEQGNFADHRAGRRNRTMDDVELARAQLEMHLITPDRSLLYVLWCWQQELNQRGNDYWRLRNGEKLARYEYEAQNALSQIGSMASFITSCLAAYGRAIESGARAAVVRELAKGVSRAALRQSQWDIGSGKPFDTSAWVWDDLPHPPLG